MKGYAVVALTFILLSRDVFSQLPPRPECQYPSNVSIMLEDLRISRVFGTAQISDSLYKQLRSAAHADYMGCSNVETAMHSWVDETLRLMDENQRLRAELENLRLEISN